jgi:hypothetical protein
MSTVRTAFILALLALLAGSWIYHARQAARLQAGVETLQQQQGQLNKYIRQLERERDEATNRLGAVNSEVARLKSGQETADLLKLRGEVGVLRRQLALVKAEAASPSGPWPKMMKDPAMKEFMRQSNMNFIKWNFGSLFKELNLTPEQIDKAVQLIADQGMKTIEKMYSLPQGTLSPAEIAQAKDAREAELNELLRPVWGDAGCAKFKQFFEDIPAHATVDLLNGQLGANQLSSDQSDRLYRVVKAEPFDLTRGVADLWDPAFWGSQEHIDHHLLQVAESNQRVLQQAGSFLTPEQLTVLSTVLSNGINSRITQAAALIPKP